MRGCMHDSMRRIEENEEVVVPCWGILNHDVKLGRLRWYCWGGHLK